MLGWFKKKFSKKKKQDTPLEQESVPGQEQVIDREDEESLEVLAVDDGKENSAQQEMISESAAEDSVDEPDDDQQEIPSVTSPVIENVQEESKETGSLQEPEVSPASIVEDSAGTTIEAEDLPAPLADAYVASIEDESVPEDEVSAMDGEESCCVEEEQEERQQAGIACDEEIVVSEPDEEVIPAVSSSLEQSAEYVEETVKEVLIQEESPSVDAGISEEETLEDTLAELIEEADKDAALLEELTHEADLGIVDQPLEELLATEQPDDEDFCGKDVVVAEREPVTPIQEETEPVEGQVSQELTAADRESTTEEGDHEPENIVDQPLEELLAEEQPDEVSGVEESAIDLLEQEDDRPEDENDLRSEQETAVSGVTAEKPTRMSLFQRLQERLGKTRQGLLYRLDSIFLGKKEIDEDLLDELEEILITSDLGVATAMDLLDAARRQVKRKELSDPQALKKILRDKILGYLLASDQPAELVMPESGPFVIMVVGVNGVGKTTTIGKIANKFKESGQSVLLIAADTFRAAAIDQLKIWAQRVGTEIIAHKPGADPSSVVFDGLDYGVSNDFDAIIIDTAGRLHTSVNLMEELKKIRRVIAKKMPGAPHEVLLVLDATTGQNGISQAKLFGEAVGVSGLALTKLDGTAKGGIVANVCRELKIPVRFIGIGEQMDDLRDFDAHEFVDALFAEEADARESSVAA